MPCFYSCSLTTCSFCFICFGAGLCSSYVFIGKSRLEGSDLTDSYSPTFTEPPLLSNNTSRCAGRSSSWFLLPFSLLSFLKSIIPEDALHLSPTKGDYSHIPRFSLFWFTTSFLSSLSISSFLRKVAWEVNFLRLGTSEHTTFILAG